MLCTVLEKDIWLFMLLKRSKFAAVHSYSIKMCKNTSNAQKESKVESY